MWLPPPKRPGGPWTPPEQESTPPTVEPALLDLELGLILLYLLRLEDPSGEYPTSP